jgi:anti-sigma B factor antagonist
MLQVIRRNNFLSGQWSLELHVKPKMVEPLRIDRTAHGGDAVLTVTGRVTINSSPALRDELLATLQKEALASLTIDLSAVPYIDGSGLATLVEALRFARSAKVSLRLKLHERPLYLFEVTGLLPLFDPSPDTTLNSVSQANA